MKNIRIKKLVVPFIFCALLTVFIFYNSLKGPTATNSDSGLVMSVIKPIIDRFVSISEENLHWLVRKSAHFIEFCWLGLATSSFSVMYRRCKGKTLLGLSMFYCLFVGVIDEFIQSFTNRTSSVRDVVLDFSGALVGILIVCLIDFIVRKTKHKKHKNKAK